MLRFHRCNTAMNIMLILITLMMIKSIKTTLIPMMINYCFKLSVTLILDSYLVAKY